MKPTKDIARVLRISGNTKPAHGRNTCGELTTRVALSSVTLSEALGDDTGYQLDNALYALRWYVYSGRAPLEFEQSIEKLSLYKLLGLVRDAASETPGGSVRQRVDVLKRLLQTANDRGKAGDCGASHSSV